MQDTAGFTISRLSVAQSAFSSSLSGASCSRNAALTAFLIGHLRVVNSLPYLLHPFVVNVLIVGSLVADVQERMWSRRDSYRVAFADKSENSILEYIQEFDVRLMGQT